jgi:hypothetical protein
MCCIISVEIRGGVNMLKMKYEISKDKVEIANEYDYEDIVRAVRDVITENHLFEESKGVIVGAGTGNDFAY